jgi:hypothetical protein
MAYHIQKPSLIDQAITVYYAGEGRWTDDSSQKLSFGTKTSATKLLQNSDGKNGGWNNSVVIKSV